MARSHSYAASPICNKSISKVGEVMKQTGFAEGLFEPYLLDSANVKVMNDRDLAS